MLMRSKIYVRADSVDGFDVHNENEVWLPGKVTVIFGKGRQVRNQKRHDTIKEVRDEFSRITTGRNNRSNWIVGFVDFG